ncbi:MAG: prepilin peptidase [Gemmatimonadetes bacterium]|nr:prepilin peptidase [Gemmatimonadota bacterium]
MNLFTDPVFLVETAMLASLLAVGFYTGYTDLKARRVPNRYTLALLGIGLIGQTAMVALDVTTFGRVAALLGIGLAVAVGLTLFGFWAPGDAKLFWAAVAALPPSLCPSPEPLAMQAAPFALILNSLICYLLVLLLVPLWRREKETARPGGRQWLRAALGLAGLLGLTLAFAWLVLGRPLSYLEAFAALVAGWVLLDRGLEEKYWGVILVPGLAALLYLSHTTGAWQTCVLMLGAVWVLEVVYLQVRFQYGRALVQALPAGEVQAGDVPRTTVSAKDGEALCEEGRGLTKAQARRLRELGRKGSLAGNAIELEQAFPFAPFLAAGALLTALFAGNLAPPLIDLGIWLRGG